MRIKERFISASVNTLKAAAPLDGVSIIGSGTLVASVSATGVKSGDAIFTQPMQFGGAVSTVPASRAFATMPISVRAGAFEISIVGSVAQAGDLPVAWFVVRR